MNLKEHKWLIIWKRWSMYIRWSDSSNRRVWEHWLGGRLLAVSILVGSEGPIRRTREGGSEWEPIKILLEGDGNSNKMNAATKTRLRLTTQVGQAHVATGVPLDLGTNTQPFGPRTQRDTKPRVYRPTPVRPVSTTGQTGPCWWNWATFTKWLYTGQTGETHRSDRSQPESPQGTK
jgi:hypothetical protein